MKVIVTAVTELWGLFVDDGRLAVALVVWCGLTLAGGLSLIGAPARWQGPILFVGCLVILVASVLDSAHRLRKR